jgi:hypothetical protein
MLLHEYALEIFRIVKGVRLVIYLSKIVIAFSEETSCNLNATHFAVLGHISYIRVLPTLDGGRAHQLPAAPGTHGKKKKF